MISQSEQQEANNNIPVRDLEYHDCNLCRKSYLKMANLKRHTKKCLSNYLKHDVKKQSQKNKFENTYDHFQKEETNIDCSDCGETFLGIGTLIKHRLKCFSDIKLKDEEENPQDILLPDEELSTEKNEPVCDLLVKDEVADDNFSDDGFHTTQDTSLCEDDFDNVGHKSEVQKIESDGDENKSGGDSKRPLACNLCPKILANKRYLKLHILNKHSEETKVVCEYCAKDVKSTNIKNHIKEMHTNVVESKCPICGKVFPRKKPMTDHMRRVHSEEVRVVCPYCAKDVKSTNIKNHIKEMHTNVQETKCPICEKIFPRKKPMTDHMRLVHSEEKGVCDICCKTFENRTYLLRHIRTFHSTSDSIYTCQFCYKQFKSSLLMRNHIKIVHVVNNVECGICGKVYKNKILLGKHHRKYHRAGEEAREACGQEGLLPPGLGRKEEGRTLLFSD